MEEVDVDIVGHEGVEVGLCGGIDEAVIAFGREDDGDMDAAVGGHGKGEGGGFIGDEVGGGDDDLLLSGVDGGEEDAGEGIVVVFAGACGDGLGSGFAWEIGEVWKDVGLEEGVIERLIGFKGPVFEEDGLEL